MVPVSLLAVMMETSVVEGVQASARALRSMRPWRSTFSQVTLNP